MIRNPHRGKLVWAALLLLGAAACGDDAEAPSSDAGGPPPVAGSGSKRDAGDRPAPPVREDAGRPPMAADAGAPDAGPIDVGTLGEDSGTGVVEPPPAPEPLGPPIVLLTSAAGTCAFESLRTATAVVDNPACPDGVFRGDVVLRHEADIEALHDCIRISGDLTVELVDREDLRGLESLRMIEGALRIPARVCAEGSCTGDNAQLVSLRGLDNLRCVGGDVSIAQAVEAGCASLDFEALRKLVEVGGSLEVLPCNGADTDQLDSLQRVWGDLTYSVRITPERLQIVYGALNALGPLGSFPSDIRVGCRGRFVTCFDGVVGCAYEAQNQAHVAALAMCQLAMRDLTLSGTSITSLAPLANLREVRGQLTIGSVGAASESGDLGRLTSLTGLESLQSVGRLAIGRQPFLTNLLALESLTSARSIRLDDLDGLLDVTGLENLTELGGSEVGDGVLWISGSASLDTLTGLRLTRLRELHLIENSALSSVAALETLSGPLERLALHTLPALNSLDGLQGVTSVRMLDIANCSGLIDLSELSLVASESIQLSDIPSLSTLRYFIEPEVTQLDVLRLDLLPSLDNLTGLESVTKVRELGITRCDGLVDLTGLGGLFEVHERFSLEGNAQLASLSGAGKLARVSTLQLLRNPELVSVGGLTSLASVGLRAADLPLLPSFAPLLGVQLQSLELLRLGLVSDLHGLEGAGPALRTLLIAGNPALADLGALTSVQTIQNQLLIADNPQITSLHGLEGLRTVPAVAITNNMSLEEIRALAGMTQGRVVVTDNASLPECEVEWLSARLPEPIPAAKNGPPGSCPPDG